VLTVAHLARVLVCTVSLLATMAASAGAAPRSVLLIYGEARLVPAIVAIDRGLRSTLEAGSRDPIRFYTEYIDLSWLAGDGNERDLLRLLGRKYAASHLDLIVVCGDGVSRLILRERAALFPDVPVVFCRPAFTALGQPRLPPGVTGVSMPLPWAATLDIVWRLHPDIERVVFVGGAGDSDRGLEAQAREAFSGYHDRGQFSYLTGLPMPRLLEAIQNLPDRTVIVFGGFLRDGAGRTFTTPEAVQLVASVSRVPMYSVADTLLGHGIVGGAMIRFEALGTRAAELGLRVLGGDPPGPEVIMQDASVSMFDARQLQRWGISERRLPAGSVVQFRSPSVWEVYKWPIASATALVALQTILIVGLLVERRRRRRAQQGLDERLRFESLLAELSTRFLPIAPEEVDRLIQSSLRRIVETLDLDRASLARFVRNGEQLSLTHSATQGGTGPAPAVVATARFPWTTQRLRQGHLVRLSRIDELPPEAIRDRESFVALGTRSIVIVPLVIGNEVVGGLGFTSLHAERTWPEDVVQRLRLLGEVFATALARKQAESAMRESHQRLVLMMETAPCMIWMSGIDGRCTYFNAHWLEFTGRTLEQELGDGWAGGVHPEDRTHCLDGYRQAFTTRSPFTLEYRLRRADGEYRWLLDYGVPRFEGTGEFVGYMGSCIDVTDIRAARQVLLEHTALRSAVFSSLYGQLAAIDRDGIILTVNEAWTQVAGEPGMRPLRPPVGVNYRSVVRRTAAAGAPDTKPMLEAIESVLDGRTTRASLEYPVGTPTEERWFEMVVEPFRRPEGGAVISHVDITRRRRAEDEARHQRDELAHVLRMTTMGELAGSLAHEINQPLAAIVTNAQAARRLLETPDHDAGDLQEALADISEDAKRAALIIRRLRMLFRKEVNHSEAVDLNAIVMSVAALLRQDLQRKGIAITFDLAQSLPLVSADPVQLQQVVMNLLVNASDAVVAGGDTRREIALVTTARDAGAVELSVSDTGVGVPESDLERIFDPFVTTKSQGLGMGLSISRSIVTAYRGRMWATRNSDQGLTVHVELPGQAAALASPESAVHSGPESAAGGET
jgi:PAS domain S-box-containing protein